PFMPLSSSGTIRNCAASLSWLPGGASAQSFVPPRMRRGGLACVRQMPAVRAEQLCPNAVFLPPDFSRYRTVSRQAREIFHRHTDLIEPLSLDEAYLDVSRNKNGLPT